MCQKSFLRCSSIFCGLWLLASLCWEIKIFHHGGTEEHRVNLSAAAMLLASCIGPSSGVLGFAEDSASSG